MTLFRKKPVTPPDNELSRSLRAWQLVLLGIGVVIGAGLFSITGIAAAENAGPAIVIAFIIAAVGSGLAGLCYSELAAMMPVSGSAYAYTYASMGEIVAWIIGWDLILEYAIGAATVSISWSAYVVSLLNDLNIHLPIELISSPWQGIKQSDGSMAYGLFNLPAVIINIIIAYLLITGVKRSSLANSILVYIKLGVIVTFIILGWQYINPENYHPFLPENQGQWGEFGWSGVLKASGVIFFAYIGFDAVSTAAQETKNPSRDLPIGILGSLAICTILYIAFAYVLTGLVNYKELNVAAPVALAIDQTPYTFLNISIKIAIIAGFTSVILVLLLGQSRILYAMSKDGLLPPLFSSVHPHYFTPWISNLILMVFTSGFAAFVPISVVGHMTSIGTLFAFTLVSAGVLILRHTYPNIPRPFKTPFMPWVPILAILVCLTMMVSLGWINWIRLLVWLILGLAIYFCYGYRHSNLRGK